MKNEINENKALSQTSVSGSVIQKVVVMWLGEPTICKILDVNYQINKVQVQVDGGNGSFWVDFKDCMAQYKIDWFYIKKASAEVNRLQIKRTILESSSLTDR